MSMIEKDDGGAAFPVVHPEGMGVQYFGISMRDYFAAKAMHALEPPREYVGEQQTRDSYKNWADRCYRMADAMLEARTP